ncbi:MAG TPA: hypothetical protein VGI81_13645 [Tepidisphaeraceae bacterium]|jgi:hypothetical protein
MSTAATYLHDVLSHFESFTRSRAVSPEDVHVRFFLADGSSYTLRGLKASPPASSGGWGLIQGAAEHSADAFAIREQHVVRVEFAVNPAQRGSIGLHTEVSAG